MTVTYLYYAPGTLYLYYQKYIFMEKIIILNNILFKSKINFAVILINISNNKIIIILKLNILFSTLLRIFNVS